MTHSRERCYFSACIFNMSHFLLHSCAGVTFSQGARIRQLAVKLAFYGVYLNLNLSCASLALSPSLQICLQPERRQCVDAFGDTPAPDNQPLSAIDRAPTGTAPPLALQMAAVAVL